MSSLREHVSAIKEIISKGTPTNKLQIADNFIAHLLTIGRATSIKEKFTKENSLSDFNYTTLCVPMEKSTFHDCNCVEDQGCFIFKSTQKIPKVLYNESNKFLNVLTIDGTIIDQLSIDQNKYADYGLAKKTVGFFIHDSYLYILNTTEVKTVLIKAIFEDPKQVAAIQTCVDQNVFCKTLDNDYPIDMDLVERVYIKVLTLLGYGKMYIKDNKTLNLEDNK